MIHSVSLLRIFSERSAHKLFLLLTFVKICIGDQQRSYRSPCLLNTCHVIPPSQTSFLGDACTKYAVCTKQGRTSFVCVLLVCVSSYTGTPPLGTLEGSVRRCCANNKNAAAVCWLTSTIYIQAIAAVYQQVKLIVGFGARRKWMWVHAAIYVFIRVYTWTYTHEHKPQSQSIHNNQYVQHAHYFYIFFARPAAYWLCDTHEYNAGNDTIYIGINVFRLVLMRDSVVR